MTFTTTGRLASDEVSAHWPIWPNSPRAVSMALSTCSSLIRLG
ncbi:Uncharacterised protein [Pseudomonas aeruginosa]|nr:hypothetical protein [Pseudomonas aeruginosa]VTQ29118.1 Uncharacterised protein [Pseudomonas aeruginosa]